LQNIYPIFDTILSRKDKEKLLKQRSLVIWMVGLSGSGKSTLARLLENSLYENGYLTQILDGDNLRTGVNNNLGFSSDDRKENIRRAAEVSKLFMECGIITICSFISPTEQIRSMAKSIIGADKYFEVYINSSLEACEQRDIKGLYAKARNGELKDFTGIDAPFEAPVHPDLEIRTDLHDVNKSHTILVETIIKKITY
jgi:adenylylsulfate kinase